MKAKCCLLFAMGLLVSLLCSSCALMPGRDPALTGNEPKEIPESIQAHFATHHELLAQAADYFLANHQAFDVIRDDWEASSGFFACDMKARAIKEALGQDGLEMFRELNEKAYLRSMAYFIPTENRAAALLFGFFPQDYKGDDVVIYIPPLSSSVDYAKKVENTISLISDESQHAVLVPLEKPGWYYQDESTKQGIDAIPETDGSFFFMLWELINLRF